MDCWPVTVFSQTMNIKNYMQLFDGIKKIKLN